MYTATKFTLFLSLAFSVVYYRSVAGLQVTRCTLTGSLVSFRAVYKKKENVAESNRSVCAVLCSQASSSVMASRSRCNIRVHGALDIN